MERKLLSSYDSEDQSECSCCCEDSDYSDCSCSDCDCDSTCSSCYYSPKLVYTNSKLNNKVLKELQYIEELSKSCDNSGDHVLVYNFKDQSKKNVKLHPSNLNYTSQTHLGLNEFYSGSNYNPGASHHPSTLASLHSKQLQQELLEIENLLCETSLDSNSKRNYQLSDSYSPLHSDSNSKLNSSSAHTPISTFGDDSSSHGRGNSTSGRDLNTFSSGFNTPKYRFSDSDYNDLDKLYSMLVSLDLYSYMFVVENVLDQRMKRDLSPVTALS